MVKETTLKGLSNEIVKMMLLRSIKMRRNPFLIIKKFVGMAVQLENHKNFVVLLFILCNPNKLTLA